MRLEITNLTSVDRTFLGLPEGGIVRASRTTTFNVGEMTVNGDGQIGPSPEIRRQASAGYISYTLYSDAGDPLESSDNVIHSTAGVSMTEACDPTALADHIEVNDAFVAEVRAAAQPRCHTLVDSRSHSLTADTPHTYTVDGVTLNERLPADADPIWDVDNDRTVVLEEESGLTNTYYGRVQFKFAAASANSWINVKILLAGGTEDVFYDADIPVRDTVARGHSVGCAVYTGPAVQLYGVKVVLTPTVDGTLTESSITLSKLTTILAAT